MAKNKRRQPKVPELQLVIRGHLYETAEHIGLPNVFAWIDELEAANRDKPHEWLQQQLDEYLARAEAHARLSP